MSIYFIQAPDGTLYELDATTDITQSLSGRVTSNPVESGESVTDNYVNDPKVVSLSGTISDLKSFSANNLAAKTTDAFIRGLSQLKESKQLFTFHYGNKIGLLTNCLFEKLDFSQDKTRGSTAPGIDSFRVDIIVKQVRLASRAALLPVRNVDIADAASDQKAGSGSTETVTDTTLLATGQRWVLGALAE